jgi:hypothetical protein
MAWTDHAIIALLRRANDLGALSPDPHAVHQPATDMPEPDAATAATDDVHPDPGLEV